MSKRQDGIAPEELTIVARRVLLDGLMALHAHLTAITVVGAQAVYLRTPDAVIASRLIPRTVTWGSIPKSWDQNRWWTRLCAARASA